MLSIKSNAVLLGENQTDLKPFITVAIPHYKNREYLEIALNSLLDQSCNEFEILISDDKSPDDAYQLIPKYLQQAGKPFRYYRQSENLGYDGNVRFCLKAAKGAYVFLLGNDDSLNGPTALEEVCKALKSMTPQVAFTSYCDFGSGIQSKRAQETKKLGSGVDVAIRVFRAFSFVSGLIFSQSEALKWDTDRWDKSIYYQFYLAMQIIGSGGDVATISTNAVRQYNRINGVTAPGTNPWVNLGCSFKPRYTGMDSVIRVTAYTILPFVDRKEQSKVLRSIFAQIFSISYPNALFHYRQMANWSFAVGVARRMWPAILFSEYKYPYRDAIYPEFSLKLLDRLYLWTIYILITILSLTIPVWIFNKIRGRLVNYVQRRQQDINLNNED